MSDLSAFPITKRWPPKRADKLQLYSFPTPNGQKISAALEEFGLDYDGHRINIMANETWTPEFLSLNPNGKIPAILDPNGPGGAPIALFESGAILIYLADKTGKLIPADPARRYETMQWVIFQNAGIGPMFGQVGFFYRLGGKGFEDKRPLERYVAESKRLLGVLDGRLENKQWLMGDDFTIADLSTFSWVNTMITFYEARDLVGYDDLKNVLAWLDRVLARPAVQRGMSLPSA